LTPQIASPKTKNISFNWRTQRLQGAVCHKEEHSRLQQMMARYVLVTRQFLQGLFPAYKDHLQQARTSYRPIEILGRVTSSRISYRKDDTRLHVDAFPSTPTHGRRILRVFSNINPHGKDRLWRLGDVFTSVANYFLPRLRKPFLGQAMLLQALNATKG